MSYVQLFLNYMGCQHPIQEEVGWKYIGKNPYNHQC